ncbi:tRNA/rRNA cytosine-C5-methylase [Ordospora colligata]|uniref:tRNA/rRNA cytosine-C5-methylase n=1 Tax=Ordospora colligata OC4 TaxID=1354746 RepID=A0A0B2UNA5_9MICR|nr:tRNA/rRNA cytosine-C5-methylase [Ordospora colligata OC4]KHN70445.1 tRNA/rRNA cytosine-C5-methylase [Ordospora colligata OC4]TBU17195.1 tRNA/rRNA cytosine-C5-methylase [Ordospora colligata]TBU17445.1 tRNA/rRNA cytosine-C5-methylase [Ordospora colligata]TBU19625.1 tRNA/rRNA cytosine-C5-methylase [Ordospora colligata]
MAEGYNEYLLEKIYELFPKKEAEVFIEESEKPRPTTIRVNTLLKQRKDVMRMLASRGADVDELPWNDSGCVIFRSTVPIGATPEYLAGYYCLQGAASMLPVLNMELKEGLCVVDMCAAPGGKSGHIAALMNNTGVLYANDVNEDRIAGLKGNLQRMGVSNCVVMNMDGRKMNVGKVDRVLLDAPCSGTGVISKDASVKSNKSRSEIDKIVVLQKELIQHAFEMLRPGGILVYSTCSVLVKENEEVVNYLVCKNSGAKVVECEVDVGKDGLVGFRGRTFHSSLKHARRVYPHVHNMDGFFYAKVLKTFD